MSTYDYPFDETGLKTSNRIVGEQHILTVVNEHQYSKVIPRWAPFYADGFQARIRLPNNDIYTLVEGEDFYFGHYFASASRATGKNIYGSINLLNRSLQGAVIIDSYQTVGGKWTQSAEKILEILTNQIYNPRLVYWEEIAEVPEIFPVVDHEWNIADMVGMSDVTAKLSEIVSALLLTSDSGLVEHTSNMNNPHGTTKFQVGLGLVENYPPATEAEARDARNNFVYMTGLRTRQAIEEIALSVINAHIAAEGNVHNLDLSELNAVSETMLTQALLTKLGVNETAFDSNRLNGMTVSQLTNSILLGTAANAMQLAGFSYEDLLAEIASQPVDNALQLEGHSLAQILDTAGQQTAVDSERLNNETVEDFAPRIPILANHGEGFSIVSSGSCYPENDDPYYVRVGESTIPVFDPDNANHHLPVRSLHVKIDSIDSYAVIRDTGIFHIDLIGREASVYRVKDLVGIDHFKMEVIDGPPFEAIDGQLYQRISIYALVQAPLKHLALATVANGLVEARFDVGVMISSVGMEWMEDVYEAPIPPLDVYPDAQIDGTEVLEIKKADNRYQLPLQSFIDRLPPGADAFETWKEQTGQPNATFVEFMAAIKGEKGEAGADGAEGLNAFETWKVLTAQPEATVNDWLAAIYAAANP